MSELWGELWWSVGITDISHQASVFRLHVVYIDFSPSLLESTINQYSNKSSFILEKCRFQPGGLKVLVLAVCPERQRSAWVSGLTCPTPDTTLDHDRMKAHTLKYNVRSSTPQHMNCTLNACMMYALESF